MSDLREEWQDQENEQEEPLLEGIAIVGLAGRFPKARDVETFWENLKAGVESITFFSPEEDETLKLVPSMKDDPNYIPACAFLEDIELFDASFFGYNAREAQLIDPQQRLFLEASWEALERAGYDPQQYEGRIGVFAGAGANYYFRHHLYPKRSIRETAGAFQLRISSDNDYVATRVSHKLGLKGPSLTVQTACSTSLTAIGLACQSLLNYQSDMALAGGVSIGAMFKSGYVWEQGSISSKDGHCRPFDAQASGTVPGNGLGVVVLKRLEDALADGDQIYAVIRGVAINNDGSDKIGFTAPSIEGQSEVILEALGIAGVEADSISYVEAHGTGTHVGDPIEIAGITQAYRVHTDRNGYCAIGSLKSNMGHLDVAAGVAGVIKTALSLHHKTLVPSLHYHTPNPQIDFAGSPFYVNTECKPWPQGKTARRAGVSSFGLGGTNVHAVLEEAPELPLSGPARPAQLLMLSAKTRTALEQATDQLADHLAANPELELADVAYTLQKGRRAFNFRRVLVGSTREEIITDLRERTPQKMISSLHEPLDRPLAFLFSGQGGQYVNMGRELYESEAVYREAIDTCAELLEEHLQLDLRDVLFPTAEDVAAAEALLQQNLFTQVSLFVTQYAMTQLLQTWGLAPQAMIGHSIGEFASACLAGVMSLEDALYLVSKRGQFMQESGPGAMLSVDLPEQEVLALLDDRLSLAAVNGPSLCVVSGLPEDVHALAERLNQRGIESRLLHISVACHSYLMDEAMAQFREVVRQVELQPPTLPFVSCLTGTWITDEQATSPEYWAEHLRGMVRYADGVQELLADSDMVAVEVGPGRTLTMLLRQQQALEGTVSITTIRHPREPQSDVAFLLQNVGRLWLSGVSLDADGFYAGQSRRRVLLPTYPFERRRYWVENSPEFSHNLASAGEADDEWPLEMAAEEADTSRSHLLNEYVPPSTATEQKVVAIWQEYLGTKQLGIHDNFFELGGHSLLGIKLMKKTREEFGIDLSERILYEKPTIAELCREIDSSQQTVHPIVPIPRDRPLLASWTQERIWRREQQYPGESYAISIGMELFGSLEPGLFERALTEVIKRHETMRTSFAEQDGQLVQKIAEPFAASVPFVDLTQLPAEEREAEMLRHAYAAECVPFDMTVAPLWRISLYRVEEERYGLFLSGHASVWDGHSLQIVINEANEIYAALEKGETWSLPELTVQYADYAQWERDRYQGEALEKGLAHWRPTLEKPVELLELPTDTPRTGKWYGFGVPTERKLSRSLSERLKSFGAAQGATLYVTMLSAFQMLISRKTGQEDLLLETSFANRAYSELDHLVAPLANFVGMRTDLSGDPSYEDVMERTKDAVYGSIEQQNFPFAKVLEELSPELYAHREPYFRLLITFHSDRDFIALPNMRIGDRLWARRALFDIYISIGDYADGIVVASEYNSELFRHETVERLFEEYEQVLTELVENPQKRLSGIGASAESLQA